MQAVCQMIANGDVDFEAGLLNLEETSNENAVSILSMFCLDLTGKPYLLPALYWLTAPVTFAA